MEIKKFRKRIKIKGNFVAFEDKGSYTEMYINGVSVDTKNYGIDEECKTFKEASLNVANKYVFLVNNKNPKEFTINQIEKTRDSIMKNARPLCGESNKKVAIEKKFFKEDIPIFIFTGEDGSVWRVKLVIWSGERLGEIGVSLQNITLDSSVYFEVKFQLKNAHNMVVCEVEDVIIKMAELVGKVREAEIVCFAVSKKCLETKVALSRSGNSIFVSFFFGDKEETFKQIESLFLDKFKNLSIVDREKIEEEVRKIWRGVGLAHYCPDSQKYELFISTIKSDSDFKEVKKKIRKKIKEEKIKIKSVISKLEELDKKAVSLIDKVDKYLKKNSEEGKK